MNLGNRWKHYNKPIMLGYVFLIPASVMNWMLTHHVHVAARVADGVVGILYGITIGCFIAGLIQARRAASRPDRGSCA